MPSVSRSYKRRIYPTRTQRCALEQWFGAARWVWNETLAIRSEGYRHCALRLTGVELSRWLTQWKKTPGHEWLTEVPATCLVQVLRDQDRAFGNFFAKRAKYPRRKRRGTAAALRFQDVSVTGWATKEVRLPKLGRLDLAEDLPEVACPDMMTLSRDSAGRYFVSFSAEVAIAELPKTGRAVGVDLGLKHLAVRSDGRHFENPKRLAARLRYLRQQQRGLARCERGSRRRERQKLRVARAHARVSAQRQCALHNLTTQLVREHDVICIEDLNVKGLARGWHARAVADAALGEIRRQLKYKCHWYGRRLIEVDRFYPSSRTCSNPRCGHVLDELRLDVREWTCPKCGVHHDRDVNAAKNLLAQGQLAGRDGRDLCVDARGPCAEETQMQVLADEAQKRKASRGRMERRWVA